MSTSIFAIDLMDNLTRRSDLEGPVVLVGDTTILLCCTNLIYVGGIPANVLTLVVLQKRSVKDRFVTILMSVMCLVALWCLSTGLFTIWWMGVSGGVDIADTNKHLCLYHWFVTLTGLEIQHFLVITITVWRIYHLGNQKRVIHNMKTLTSLYIFCIFVVACLPGFFLVKSSLHHHYYHGQLTHCEMKFENALNVVYFTTTLVLPPVLLVFLNTYMFWAYRTVTPLTMRLRGSNIASKKRLKLLVVLTDVLFFMTSVPSILFYEISRRIFPVGNDKVSADRRYERVVVFCMLYLGFAFNTLVYCCFGRSFRSELKVTIIKYMHKLGVCNRVNAIEEDEIPYTTTPFSIFVLNSLRNEATDETARGSGRPEPPNNLKSHHESSIEL